MTGEGRKGKDRKHRASNRKDLLQLLLEGVGVQSNLAERRNRRLRLQHRLNSTLPLPVALDQNRVVSIAVTSVSPCTRFKLGAALGGVVGDEVGEFFEEVGVLVGMGGREEVVKGDRGGETAAEEDGCGPGGAE
jgi:hypothetical protein